MAAEKRISQKADRQKARPSRFKVEGPIIDTAFNSYCSSLVEHFTGKGDLYDVKRFTRCALQNGIGAEEVISLLRRSADSRQYERMVQRRLNKKLRIAELPLEFTPLEVEFAKKILNLRPNTIASLSKFCAKPGTLRHAYCSLLELEPVIVGRYLSQADFDSALSDICDYFGLDGDPPLKVMLISKESMASVMQLLLDVKKNL